MRDPRMSNTSAPARLSTLEALESEGIHILREAVATARKPVILFSGGKDSVAVLHLATKAFWPGRVPIELLHVDTGHNFDEVIAFRDATVERPKPTKVARSFSMRGRSPIRN